MNKVLLINTSFREKNTSQYSFFGPPMGLLYIAASLEKHGYSVELIDPQTTPDYLNSLHAALSKQPLFVGMSTYLGENIKHAVEFSQLIKSNKSDIPIVLGGPLASSIPEVFFNEMPVDYIVMGSGEVTIVKLADALSVKKDPRTLSNISYRNEGNVILGEMYVFEGNLDDLPLPDFEKWRKGITTMGSIPIITSRGCHRGCAFCYNTFTGRRKFYLRSPESVISEMERWSNQFNIKRFQFFDDNFLLDSRRAITILDEMGKREWKIERLFGHLNEFNHVAPDQLAATVIWLVMCIESASLRIQKLLNKRINLEKALDLIARITEQNIHFVTAFMFGLPTETDEDIRLSIEFANQIRKIEKHNISMCYIYAPQPKDAIVRGLNPDQQIDFSLDALSNVEVVPVPPDNKVDLRLRPWMGPSDQEFYLDFVQVWQYHFANFQDPNFDLDSIYSRSKRIRNLFRNISPPIHESNFSRFTVRLNALKSGVSKIWGRFASIKSV
jgi:anaerobic magnesium-protoporphyrin IX monomethyl ester cyclase